MQVSQYRVTLFKRKLREIMGTPWLRFDTSVGKCHLVVHNRVRREDFPALSEDLRRAGIDHILKRNPFGLWSHYPEAEQPYWYISIPIDQEALPELKNNRGHCAARVKE